MTYRITCHKPPNSPHHIICTSAETNWEAWIVAHTLAWDLCPHDGQCIAFHSRTEENIRVYDVQDQQVAEVRIAAAP